MSLEDYDPGTSMGVRVDMAQSFSVEKVPLQLTFAGVNMDIFDTDDSYDEQISQSDDPTLCNDVVPHHSQAIAVVQNDTRVYNVPNFNVNREVSMPSLNIIRGYQENEKERIQLEKEKVRLEIIKEEARSKEMQETREMQKQMIDF